MTKIKSSLQTVRGVVANWLANLRSANQDEKSTYPTQQNRYFN